MLGYTIGVLFVCVIVFYIIDDMIKNIKAMSFKEKLLILALLLLLFVVSFGKYVLGFLCIAVLL